MILSFRRFMASLLIVSLAGFGLPLPAQAGMIATDSLAASGERERIGAMLERAEVRAGLEAYGVNPADVKARVAAMTDQEIGQLAGQLDRLPSGGSTGGDILFVALVVFLVLLLTDILGFTKVFPFTRTAKK
jgi:uncharacterized protein DUF6627